MKRITAFILSALFLCFCLTACGPSGGDESATPAVSAAEISQETQTQAGEIDFVSEGNERNMPQYETNNPVVAIKIKDYGVVVAELYPDIAPQTVYNFIYLVKKGFYDNNTIHRMKPEFVIQGGDPTGTGMGGPGYCIKGEFAANGFVNNLEHTEGVLSMARANDYDSAGSQFFIVLNKKYQLSLDGLYAAFGKVIEGMDVCREIEKIQYYNKSSGKLNDNLIIEKMVVDNKGVEYPEPEKLPGR